MSRPRCVRCGSCPRVTLATVGEYLDGTLPALAARVEDLEPRDRSAYRAGALEYAIEHAAHLVRAARGRRCRFCQVALDERAAAATAEVTS